ncbi:hypothetical protein [Pedobacter alpinus]|uniref:hypothetical protein n=1 Tax=Pedobacter alpinus TaxID=1590643 RepID=UPI00366B80EA
MLSKSNLLYNWTFIRAVKLLMGFYVSFEAIGNQQYVLLLIAALFLYQGIFNVGHCGANGCSVPKSSFKK